MLGVVLCWLTIGCIHPEAFEPAPGLLEYQSPLWLAVPGGRVNAAGGNLIVQRVDLSIDTLFGELGIGATFNSTGGAWLWSFDIRYDGALFIDETGAEHAIAGLAPGVAIPGTHWVKLDAQRIKTKGGLVHSFDPVSHRLMKLTWDTHPYPYLAQIVAPTSAGDRVVAITQCREASGCQNVFTIEYDEHGCVERIDDRAGRTALFEHDEACRTLRARDGLDVDRGWAGRRYTYLLDRLWKVVSSEGERVEYGFIDGRLMSANAVAEAASLTRFHYGRNDALGLFFTGVSDPTGAYSLYRYDAEGRLHEYVDALHGLTRMTWAGRRPTTRTDPAGVTTAWEWADDDAIRITEPSGNVIVVDYAPGAQDRRNPLARPVLRIRDDIGVVQERSYGTSGQVSAIVDGAGDRTLFTYDSEGNRVGFIPVVGAGTSLHYFGEHGHAREVWTQGFVMYRVHDEVGNLLEGGRVTEALASRRPGIGRRRFDADRNWVAVELKGGVPADPFASEVAEIQVEYRSDGQPLSIRRPYGGDSEFAYDGAGRLVSRRDRADGTWQETRTEFDARGLVTAIERPNGMRVESDYDAAGRRSALRLVRREIVEKRLRNSWVSGRLDRRLDSSYVGAESFGYDAAGRPIRIVFPGGEALEIDYDARSREIERRYLDPSGVLLRSIGLGWDMADRLVRIEDDGVAVIEKELVAGFERTIRYGNGLVREMTHDDLTGILQQSYTTDSSGEPVEITATNWTECGSDLICIATRTTTIQRPIGLPETQSEEAYALGIYTPGMLLPGGFGMRLHDWQTIYDPDWDGRGPNRQAFDVLGNRIGVAPVDELDAFFHYNAERNRLTSSDLPEHRDYVWDEGGYLVRRGEVDITWDAGGRVATIGDDVSLEWDVLGRPVRSRIEGQQTSHLFGGEVLGDATGTPLSLDLGELKIDLVMGERLYRHYDFRGNVKWVSGESGEILRHYAYGPWGVETAHGDHPDDVSFARGRKLGDLLLIGARIYDPETGRFASPDPLGHVVNQYAYTQGNPVTFWDPGGTYARPVGRPMADVTMGSGRSTIGRTLAQLGIAVVGAGILTGNPHVTFGGAVLTLTGVVLMLQGQETPLPCSCGHVGIIDLTPGQPNAASAAGKVEGSELTSPAMCAPAAAAAPKRWWLGLLIPIQVLLGGLVLQRATRTSGGRA
ncbi:MAG: hypothetical protein JRH17_04420 [Deltaproteobacteria bacterium]|nr:hypothetical protein [Deltaproteobacteria bacterium]